MSKWVPSKLYELVTAFLFFLINYFSPIGSVITVTILFVLADLASGLYKSFRLGKGLESKIGWRTVEKTVLALLLVMLAYVIETTFKLTWFPAVNILAGIICCFEFWSILENFSKISDAPFLKFIKKFMETKVEAEFGQKISEK